MRKIEYSKQFSKDLKKINSAKKFNTQKRQDLVDCLNTLASGEALHSGYHDHKFVEQSRKEFVGMREFHISGNICVIYRLTDYTLEVDRIGSHNYLHLTENLK